MPLWQATLVKLVVLDVVVIHANYLWFLAFSSLLQHNLCLLSFSFLICKHGMKILTSKNHCKAEIGCQISGRDS